MSAEKAIDFMEPYILHKGCDRRMLQQPGLRVSITEIRKLS